jgi:hypothetical protein
MPRRSATILLTAAVLSLVSTACGRQERPDAEVDEIEAIRAVLAQDDSLGAVRNHAPENMPLSAVIRDYVTGLESINFRGCPESFTTAFQRHRQAWERSIPFFARFDTLRGEMHDLFEEIRQRDAKTREGLEAAESDIWGTWGEVEAAARNAGAMPE